MPSVINNPMNKKSPKFGTTGNYSKGVLIGNWYEERFKTKVDPNAITPGLYGVSHCINAVSDYAINFKQPIPKDSDEGCADYFNWKQTAFANRIKSEGSNVLLYNGKSYKKNMTTVSDYLYRMVPYSTDILSHKTNRDKEDMMVGMGNQTQFGLRHYKNKILAEEECYPADLSIYKQEFTHKLPIAEPDKTDDESDDSTIERFLFCAGDSRPQLMPMRKRAGPLTERQRMKRQRRLMRRIRNNEIREAEERDTKRETVFNPNADERNKRLMKKCR